MTEQELHEKLTDILQMKLQELPLKPLGIIYKEAAEYLAVALIAEGIGDVCEYERLKTELRSKVDYIHELWDVKEDYKHRAEVAEKAFDLINKENPSCFVPYSCCGLDCRECTKKYFYEQAEKELQEETNNV